MISPSQNYIQLPLRTLGFCITRLNQQQIENILKKKFQKVYLKFATAPATIYMAFTLY